MMRRARGVLSSAVVSVLLMVPALPVAAHAGEPVGHQSGLEQRKTPSARSTRTKALPQHGSKHRFGTLHSAGHGRPTAFRHVMFATDATAPAPGQPQVGLASWYGGRHWEGQRTSSGSMYNAEALTAAHATLPLGSRVRVSLAGSDREVIVTINDRPGTRTRIIDLSRAAARELGILTRGVAMVTLTPL